MNKKVLALMSALIVVIIFLLNCSENKIKTLTLTKRCCPNCNFEEITDSTFAEVLTMELRRTSSLSYSPWSLNEGSDTLRFKYFRYYYDIVQCDSCIARKLKEEEEKKKAEELASKMQSTWKRQITAKGWV